MGKKEYMDILLSQIRNDKAKTMVEEEIGAHIDDQAEVYMEFGVDAETAEKKAVRSMGDPVEIGVSLDRIHKPKMSWSMIVLVGIISVIGLVIQGLSWAQAGDVFFFHRQIAFVTIGFACMMIICFIDYSFFVQRGKILAVLYLIALFWFIIKGVYINGSFWMRFGPFSFSWQFFMYLSIPIFGILLYLYRKQNKRHLLIPVGFLIISAIVFYQIGYSMVVLTNTIFMAMVIFTFAIVKGWYPVKTKRFLIIVWACVVGAFAFIPSYTMIRLMVLRSYAAERLHYFIKSEDGPYTVYGTFRPIRELLSESDWIGGDPIRLTAQDLQGILSDYVLLHTAVNYGILVVIILIALLAVFCGKLFSVSIKQKNQVGTIIGISCGLIFAVQIGEYILMNLGLIPGTTAFLPLFSYGGSGTVVSFILLGFLLSIYRYQNLVTDRKPKKKLVVKLIDVQQ